MTKSPMNAAVALCCAAAAVSAQVAQPTYLARLDYALAADGIALGDTNGDGIPDLIYCPGHDVSDVAVLLGNGNGTFRTGPTSDIGRGIGGAAAAADLNAGGTVDLVYATVLSDQFGVGVSLGNGDGTFQPATFYPAGSDQYLGNAILGDFNGDGILDAVVAGESGIWLFAGKGGGVFSPGVLTPMAEEGGGTVAAADFNGDGRLDLAVTTPTGFSVLLGNGNGTFQSPKAYKAPLPGYWIAAGDLTGSGHADVVLAAYGAEVPPYVLVYLNNGKGGFGKPTRVGMSPVEQIAVQDVNGDGIPDLIGSLGYVALGNGDGAFGKPTIYPLPSGGGRSYLATADLLNNGRTDIAFLDGDSSVSVLLNIGKGKFEDGEWTAVEGGAGCGAAADYNGDGHPDLAVNTPNGVSILLGTGQALHPFTPGATIALAGAGCLVTGDLNGDGIADLLVPSNGTVVAYLGNGDGSFTQSSVTQNPNGGYLAVGDFNHDGNLDLATSGNVLALGKGDGKFYPPTAIVPGQSGFTNIAAADLNGDGWTDLVVDDNEFGYADVLLNDQKGGFNVTQIELMVGRALWPATQIVLAPLTSGAAPAMVLAGSVGGAAIYFNNGSGAFTFGEQIDSGAVAPFGGDILAVSDLNGDGIPDLIMTEGGGGSTLGIFLGNGDGTFANPYYVGAGPEPGDLLLENLHGQRSCSGSPDIVAPDVTGGVMVLIDLTVAKCPGS